MSETENTTDQQVYMEQCRRALDILSDYAWRYADTSDDKGLDDNIKVRERRLKHALGQLAAAQAWRAQAEAILQALASATVCEIASQNRQLFIRIQPDINPLWVQEQARALLADAEGADHGE